MTFLFTDIQDSTPLWEREPEKMAAALQVHNTTLCQAIEANGGAVFKTVGDAFQAAFATAPQALKAAIEGQRALQSAPWNELGELKVRMGLHTGEAELDPGGDEYAVSHSKNRIGRIHSAAHGGQILLSAEIYELCNHQLPPGVSLKDMGEHHLKGLLLPEHLYQAVVIGLPAEFPLLASESRPSHNLPLELTAFIGRQHEIAQLEELLRNHRMVTLTGSGGVGKTRLSIQVAGQMLAEFPNGVWYAELAPISDPDLVSHSVAAVLGLREEPNRPILETLGVFLSKRELLLVLDNCEHLLEACARLADILLRKAPRLRILTSSREALGITGETTFRVPSLAAPDPHQMPSLPDLQQYEAVQLFTERARGVLPTFEINKDNAPAIAAICQRLDGIPLALELAAARLNMLTAEQLASRLDHAFRLLTGGSRTALPRQQTLRAAIDWSYKLLSTPEQVLLGRLAVFAGGSTLEAAEAVCSGEGVETEYILELLGGLVNKSMINAERQQQEDTRYRLLETVRQYAREKLFDSGESESLRSQHLDYYVALCEAAYPHIHGAGRIEWTRKLQQEYDNIREALEWAFHDPILALQGLRIATSISERFWLSLGLFREGVQWLNAGLDAAGEILPRLLKVKVLTCLPYLLRDPDLIHAAYDECVALCREIGPQADKELCLTLALHTFFDFEHSPSLVAEAVQIARALGQAGTWELGEALFWYSVVLWQNPQGAEDDMALAAAEESIQIQQAGDRWSAGGYWTIGFIQTQRGQDEPARQSLEKALELHKEADDVNGTWFSLFFLTWHHRLVGRYALAKGYCMQLFASAEAVGNEFTYTMFAYSCGMVLVSRLNDPLTRWDATIGLKAVRIVARVSRFQDAVSWAWYARLKPLDLRALDLVREKLGEEAFTRAWKEGLSFTLEQAVALAREGFDE